MHSSQKKAFTSFLNLYLPDISDKILPQFEQYHELLWKVNQKVNLISRQMDKEDYWTHHFLDSLLILKCLHLMEMEGKVLDFGSGGGLPGIPLKLIFPKIQMTLLDSVRKKVICLQNIIAQMQIKDCKAIWMRLEEYALKSLGNFDFIVSRSVKVLDNYIEPLTRLLKQNGQVIFYKAQYLEDISSIPDIKIYDVSTNELGTRKIVFASEQSLKKYAHKRNI